MKIKTFIWAIVFWAFCVSTFVWAGGITGGTTRNTTERQHDQTRGAGYTGGYKTPSWIYKGGKKAINQAFPITGTSEKLIKGMKWSTDRQRNIGGVPPTGDTVRGNYSRKRR